MNYFKKALSFLLTFLLLSQHSFSMENEKEDPSHIIKLFEEHHKKNPELLNSSKEKDIVVFLGKTGSGKSTLINYLSDKELKVTERKRIILKNPSDPQAMKIGETFESETFLPKYIQHNNLLLCDLPGFGDTGGTAKHLINACFIKNIIENSKTARVVFVAGYNEVTAGRGELFKKLLLITEKLIPNEQIEDFSSLVITKTKSGKDNFEFIENLKSDVDVELIAPWITKESLTQMSSPSKKEINQRDKENITNIILKTANKKINNINISAVYDEKEKSNIKNIYDEKIKDIADLFIKEKININNISSLDINNLEIKKQYFQTNCLNDLILSIESAPLIKLLRPVSEEIYISSFNEAKKKISLQISHIEEKINVEIKEQQKKKLEEEKKEEENKRIQEENRRKQVEEQLRLEQERIQKQHEIIKKQNLDLQRLLKEEELRKQKEKEEEEKKKVEQEKKRIEEEEKKRFQTMNFHIQKLQSLLESYRIHEESSKNLFYNTGKTHAQYALSYSSWETGVNLCQGEIKDLQLFLDTTMEKGFEDVMNSHIQNLKKRLIHYQTQKEICEKFFNNSGQRNIQYALTYSSWDTGVVFVKKEIETLESLFKK